MQVEKEELNLIINNMLKSLHTYFPWIVVEIIYIMQERMGVDNIFIKTISHNVLDDISQETLEEYLPECLPDELESVEVGTSIFNIMSKKKLRELVGESVFGVESTTPAECLPWDIEEKDSFLQDTNATAEQIKKISTIRFIKDSLQILNNKKDFFEANNGTTNCYKNEIEAIKVLNFVLKA